MTLPLVEELKPLTGVKYLPVMAAVCTTSCLPLGAGVKAAPLTVGNDAPVSVTDFDCDSEWQGRGTSI